MSTTNQYDVLVIGAGVVGLATAWQAARRGKRVAICERTRIAQGASVRNFGLICPLAQPAGELYETALRSRQLWLELAGEAGFWIDACGLLLLIHRDDERAVVEEFVASEQGQRAEASWLDAEQVRPLAPFAITSRLQGAIYSRTELGVNPSEAIGRIPCWLRERFGVDLHFETTIARVQPGAAISASAERFEAAQIWVCGGHETDLLFPELLREQGVFQCRLQMMRTAPQPDGKRVGPHLAGGLTLQHSASFADCAALAALKTRIEAETPELNRFGIHVIVSQNQFGEMILGDSHQYGEAASPFDSAEIEALIIRELKRLVDLPDWTIAHRWHGIYAMHAEQTIIHEQPVEGVQILMLPGGAGMTLSMGVADRLWDASTS